MARLLPTPRKHLSATSSPSPALPSRSRALGARSFAVRLAVVASVAVALLAGLAHAQTTPPANLKERFNQADKNHDGKLDREEYYQLVVEIFYLRDKNKDGYLMVEELQGVVSPEVFKAINSKADGKITLQDWTNALFIDFDRMDTNKDGAVTYEEVEAYIRSSGK